MELLYYLGKYKHYILSFLIQIVLAGLLIHPWDGFVFSASAENFLQGITPYETALQQAPYTFTLWMQEWYAYPPLPLLLFSSTYAPYFHFLSENPVLGRIFLKLAFILGNLLCAYLVYRLIARVSSKANASKAEKIVLYNPFLIFIAAAWGMFDIWMVNFLLLSILSFRQDKLGRAGIFFGLSILVKPILVIFAPVLLVHAWNKTRSATKTTIFAFAAIITFSAISLPFFIHCPEGFTNQVIGLHLGRPMGGYTPLYLLYLGELLNNLRFISLPSLPMSTITALSVALLATAIATVSLHYYLKRERSEGGLLASLFLLILMFTLFNKLVNPQYFVIPMVLAIALIYYQGSYSLIKLGDVKRYYKYLVLPYLGAAILEGCHFLVFIPTDIALPLMGRTAAELNSQIAASFPISQDFYYFIPQVSRALLIAPAIIIAGFIVYKSLRKIIPSISEQVSAYLIKMRRVVRRGVIEKPLTVFGVSLFVTVPLLAGAVSYQVVSGEEEYIPAPSSFHQGDKIVGAFYYYWWDNSSHNPQIRSDDWLGVRLTPKEGYYSSTYAYMKGDILEMQEAGIDFALLSFHDYYLERYITFAEASEEEGFYLAPMIELSDLERRDKYLALAPTGRAFAEKRLSLTSETKAKIIDMIDSALQLKDSSAFLTYDKKPVVFLNDTFHFYPGWEREDMQYLAHSVVELYKREYNCGEITAMEKISQNWGRTITSLEDMTFYFYPRSTRAFYESQNQVEQDWADGFEYGWQQFWKDIQDEVESRHGDIFWIGDYGGGWQPGIDDPLDTAYQIFDAVFLCPSSLAQSNAVNSEEALTYWESRISLLSERSNNYRAPAIATTMPSYSQSWINIPVKIDDGLSYDYLWEIALSNKPEIVLIASWNNYYEDSCIEPTTQFGRQFIDRTEYWVSLFKAPIPSGLMSSNLEAV